MRNLHHNHLNTILIEEYGELKEEVSDSGEVFLHFEVFNFSPRLYKEMLRDFADVLLAYNQMGYQYVYTCIPKTESKIRKFQSFMGFTPYAITPCNRIIYRISTNG